MRTWIKQKMNSKNNNEKYLKNKIRALCFQWKLLLSMFTNMLMTFCFNKNVNLYFLDYSLPNETNLNIKRNDFKIFNISQISLKYNNFTVIIVWEQTRFVNNKKIWKNIVNFNKKQLFYFKIDFTRNYVKMNRPTVDKVN